MKASFGCHKACSGSHVYVYVLQNTAVCACEGDINSRRVLSFPAGVITFPTCLERGVIILGGVISFLACFGKGVIISSWGHNISGMFWRGCHHFQQGS